MRLVASVICTIFLIACLAGTMASAANNFPSQPGPPATAPGPNLNAKQPQLYYGYVPPAPIRHTWPGGYRVIFHELINTFSEHLLGQY